MKEARHAPPLPERSLPVRPNLDQLKRQAKELLRDLRSADAVALEEFTRYRPERIDPANAKLADAQLMLARAYGASSWPRIVQSCQIIDAIWENDIAAVRKLVTRHPTLIHADALVRPPGEVGNWGPPMSYAANVGRNSIIQMLHDLGAKDHKHAVGRAVLQSKISTTRLIYDLAGKPVAPDHAPGGAAYTLSDSGTAFALEIGASVIDVQGNRTAPVDVALETGSRKPAAKHAILAMYERRCCICAATMTSSRSRNGCSQRART